MHNGSTEAESHHGPHLASVKECSGWWAAFCPMPVLTFWLYFGKHVTLFLRSIPHLQSWDDTVILVVFKKINALICGKYPSISYNYVMVISNTNTRQTSFYHEPLQVKGGRKNEGRGESQHSFCHSSCCRLQGLTCVEHLKLTLPFTYLEYSLVTTS